MKPFPRYSIVAVVLLTSLFVIAGCSKGAEEELKRYTKPVRSTDYGSLKSKKAQQPEVEALKLPHSSINNEQQHQAGSVAYSSDLSDAVNSIGGVGDARVFVADHIAYIGVVLDNTGQGMIKSKPTGERDSSVLNEPFQGQMSIHNNPFQSYLTVNDTSQLSELFVEHVEETVRKLDPTITDVHLSANKEFMYYIDEFAQVVWGGQSIDPYIDQFNILINHQFFDGRVMPTSLKYYRNR